MATIDELRAALKRLEQGTGRGGLPVRPTDDDQLLWAALDELAAARPIVAAVDRLMTRHDAGCPCQSCTDERQSGLRAAWLAWLGEGRSHAPGSAPGAGA